MYTRTVPTRAEENFTDVGWVWFFYVPRFFMNTSSVGVELARCELTKVRLNENHDCDPLNQYWV